MKQRLIEAAGRYYIERLPDVTPESWACIDDGTNQIEFVVAVSDYGDERRARAECARLNLLSVLEAMNDDATDETIARALLDCHDWTTNMWNDPHGWESLTKEWREVYRKYARVARQAMLSQLIEDVKA